DAGGKIHAGGVDLALNEQRLGPYQIPDRQRNDGDDDTRDNDRRRANSDWFLDGCSLRVRFALATSLTWRLHSLISGNFYAPPIRASVSLGMDDCAFARQRQPKVYNSTKELDLSYRRSPALAL